MNHAEFEIGKEFTLGDQTYRCTDKGTRVVTAIRVDQAEIVIHANSAKEQTRVLNKAEAEAQGWFNGPPYAGVEHVFDEHDQEACHACED